MSNAPQEKNSGTRPQEQTRKKSSERRWFVHSAVSLKCPDSSQSIVENMTSATLEKKNYKFFDLLQSILRFKCRTKSIAGTATLGWRERNQFFLPCPNIKHLLRLWMTWFVPRSPERKCYFPFPRDFSKDSPKQASKSLKIAMLRSEREREREKSKFGHRLCLCCRIVSAKLLPLLPKSLLCGVGSGGNPGITKQPISAAVIV